MQIGEFQKWINERFGQRDRQRGTPATFMWLVEEIGELATALSGDDQQNKIEEFADVIAWLCTLANINEVDLEQACKDYIAKNPQGCK